jgi:hypothetical protein
LRKKNIHASINPPARHPTTIPAIAPPESPELAGSELTDCELTGCELLSLELVGVAVDGDWVVVVEVTSGVCIDWVASAGATVFTEVPRAC